MPNAALTAFLAAAALLQGCAGAGTAVEKNAAGTAAAVQATEATPTSASRKAGFGAAGEFVP